MAGSSRNPGTSFIVSRSMYAAGSALVAFAAKCTPVAVFESTRWL